MTKTPAKSSPQFVARIGSKKSAALRLKARVVALEISQIDLANELGVHPNTICLALKHGVNGPTFRAIEAIVEREEASIAA